MKMGRCIGVLVQKGQGIKQETWGVCRNECLPVLLGMCTRCTLHKENLLVYLTKIQAFLNCSYMCSALQPSVPSSRKLSQREARDCEVIGKYILFRTYYDFLRQEEM